MRDSDCENKNGSFDFNKENSLPFSESCSKVSEEVKPNESYSHLYSHEVKVGTNNGPTYSNAKKVIFEYNLSKIDERCAIQ